MARFDSAVAWFEEHTSVQFALVAVPLLGWFALLFAGAR